MTDKNYTSKLSFVKPSPISVANWGPLDPTGIEIKIGKKILPTYIVRETRELVVKVGDILTKKKLE